MTKPSNISGIETATGCGWDEWVALIDKAGGRDMDHKTIAEMVYQELDGKIDSPGWWAQGVTVAYEQHIGRRAPGQRGDGSFEVSVTKTIVGTKEDVFALWNEAHGAAKEFAGHGTKNIRKSITPVRSYWRCDLEDGSKVSVAVEQKEPEKAMIAITHTKLSSAQEKDEGQVYWKDQLEKL